MDKILSNYEVLLLSWLLYLSMNKLSVFWSKLSLRVSQGVGLSHFGGVYQIAEFVYSEHKSSA